jgi:hypothetical protein
VPRACSMYSGNEAEARGGRLLTSIVRLATRKQSTPHELVGGGGGGDVRRWRGKRGGRREKATVTV